MLTVQITVTALDTAPAFAAASRPGGVAGPRHAPDQRHPGATATRLHDLRAETSTSRLPAGARTTGAEAAAARSGAGAARYTAVLASVAARGATGTARSLPARTRDANAAEPSSVRTGAAGLQATSSGAVTGLPADAGAPQVIVPAGSARLIPAAVRRATPSRASVRKREAPALRTTATTGASAVSAAPRAAQETTRVQGAAQRTPTMPETTAREAAEVMRPASPEAAPSRAARRTPRVQQVARHKPIAKQAIARHSATARRAPAVRQAAKARALPPRQAKARRALPARQAAKARRALTARLAARRRVLATGMVAPVLWRQHLAFGALRLPHAPAARRMRHAGLRWRSSGNCVSRHRSSCTSLATVRLQTLWGLVNLKRRSGCDILVTGGTETGHAGGPRSHGTGYKIDVAHNRCIDRFIRRKQAGPVRGDGARLYYENRPQGRMIYANEPSHWDITFR
ncbi:hypothetical protein Sme01_41090 [Sphaerisporangium melleum]|uniref:Uncharacterized protein n=1 Tax=Sphaerisporangium melleum TaxID=321316 RepID=A0A917VMT9_9ACTN|nr:hypothetical protein GCM10007964_48890 [Sphaerisporangium melleum]GII71633.1 hypothetical protein Sme01_41090 [Sphaerisporangium melleum]